MSAWEPPSTPTSWRCLANLSRAANKLQVVCAFDVCSAGASLGGSFLVNLGAPPDVFAGGASHTSKANTQVAPRCHQVQGSIVLLLSCENLNLGPAEMPELKRYERRRACVTVACVAPHLFMWAPLFTASSGPLSGPQLVVVVPDRVLLDCACRHRISRLDSCRADIQSPYQTTCRRQ